MPLQNLVPHFDFHIYFTPSWNFESIQASISELSQSTRRIESDFEAGNSPRLISS